MNSASTASNFHYISSDMCHGTFMLSRLKYYICCRRSSGLKCRHLHAAAGIWWAQQRRRRSEKASRTNFFNYKLHIFTKKSQLGAVKTSQQSFYINSTCFDKFLLLFQPYWWVDGVCITAGRPHFDLVYFRFIFWFIYSYFRKVLHI